MAEPFLGEIRLFANGYAPQGWLFCEGQTVSISQNQALFSLLGTYYGGNGVTTFALPDLRGRVPIHYNPSFPIGSFGGESSHTLSQNAMPMHSHQVQASTAAADTASPENSAWAYSFSPYAASGLMTTMNSASIASAGGGQAHNNMQPYLSLHFCIATTGIYPSRN